MGPAARPARLRPRSPSSCYRQTGRGRGHSVERRQRVPAAASKRGAVSVRSKLKQYSTALAVVLWQVAGALSDE